MKLNGWRRLWIMLSGLWLIAVMVLAYTRWPTEPPSSFWEAADVVREIRPDVLWALKPRSPQNASKPGKIEIDWDELRKEQEWNAAHPEVGIVSSYEYDRANALIASAVRQRQRLFVSKAIAAWVLPVAMLYMLGWAIAWVRRGFATG